MRKSMIGLSLLALGLAGSAFAAEPKQPGEPLGDRTMTKAEFTAKGTGMFDKMDVNHDGKLDAADRAARDGANFDQLDRNKDGNVSRDEFIAAHARGGMHDAGKLDADNMADGSMAAGGKRGWRGKNGGMGRDGGRGGMVMLKLADTNGDNAVGKVEFGAARAKHFDTIDTNRDGQLTKAERQAARGKMRAMWGKRGIRQSQQPGGTETMTPPPAAPN